MAGKRDTKKHKRKFHANFQASLSINALLESMKIQEEGESNTPIKIKLDANQNKTRDLYDYN